MCFAYFWIILGEIVLKSHCPFEHLSLEIISIRCIHQLKQFMFRGRRLRVQSKQSLNIPLRNWIRNLSSASPCNSTYLIENLLTNLSIFVQ